MAYWWDCIQAPTTLKATLEFLTVLRTTLELRNAICDILLLTINKANKVVDTSKIGAFHELLDCATELRARIIGENASAEYETYKDLHHCCLKLHVCQGTYVVECDSSRGCSYIYYDDERNSPVCAFNIQTCAKKIVCILLEVLPEFYITLFAILARLWNDGTWYKLYINKSGPLCDALTSTGKIHESAGCPYAKVKQLSVGLNKADINSGVTGDQIEAVMLKLVGECGCLRTLINMMKSSDCASGWSSNYPSIGTLDKVSSWYKCTCVKRDDSVKTIKCTQRKPKPRCTPRRVPCNNRRRRNAGNAGSNTNASATTGHVDRVEGPSSSVSSSTATVASSNISSAVNTTQSTTSTHLGKRVSKNVPPFTNLISRIDGDATSTSPSISGAGTRFPYYKWNFDPNETYISEAPQNPTIYNVVAGSSQASNSSCAASGVAAGCLLVGCVGVGAAYGFNIGGFKTMVNSLF
ncbi:uncharacterized protein BcabD6B2_56320 [Babesia caballi]|uniref:Uncharacterized protein n=1 Tax=Babesia caballi TaxID=5871 RepID=A0AAV4M156_BABCB|nr:hypothetical protein BcabD6B2_56320 [Babesia caballi]